MVRNENYWGKKPILNRVHCVTIPESGAREAALQDGDIHLAIDLPPQFEKTVRANPKLIWQTDPGPRIAYMGINIFRPEFQDVSVRQAMNLAIDRDAIIKRFLMGYARKPRSYVQSTAFGFIPVSHFPYDPAKATALLREAGWKKGPEGILINDAGKKFPMVFLRVFEGRFMGDFKASQAATGYLKEIGFPTELRKLEFNVAWSEAIKPENATPNATSQLSLVSLGNPFQDGAHPLGLFDIRAMKADGAFFRYHDKDIWPLLDTMYQESDPNVRLQAMKKAQEILVPKAVWIPLYELDQTTRLSKSLKGLRVTPREYYMVTEAWLER